MAETYDDPWWRDGLCTQLGPDLFFLAYGESGAEAKRACQMCEVRLKCLADSLTTDIECGIFGGLGRDERRRLIRKVDAGHSPRQVAAEAIAREHA